MKRLKGFVSSLLAGICIAIGGTVFLSVVAFILCSFEHRVANMYYFSVTGMWSSKTLLYLLVMTLGNAVRSVCFFLWHADG